MKLKLSLKIGKSPADKTINFEKRPMGMAECVPLNAVLIENLTQIPYSALYVLDNIAVKVNKNERNH